MSEFKFFYGLVDGKNYGYEVYNESQPSFCRVFDKQYQAATYCDKANTGKTDAECMQAVEKETEKRRKQAESRKAKDEAMRSIGMKRVRGNLGGTYWE